jgi:hypothetical protein
MHCPADKHHLIGPAEFLVLPFNNIFFVTSQHLSGTLRSIVCGSYRWTVPELNVGSAISILMFST